jgi:hypothetical protein
VVFGCSGPPACLGLIHDGPLLLHGPAIEIITGLAFLPR